MKRLIISMVMCLSILAASAQSLSHDSRMSHSFSDLISGAVQLAEEAGTCAIIKGQLTTENQQPIALDLVRVQIIDLETQDAIHLTTEPDGSFETCLPCNQQFILLAYPRDYYCEEVRLDISPNYCQQDSVLRIAMPLQALQIVEREIAGSNMNELAEDSLAQLHEANKAFLESISIAEDMPVEYEDDDPSIEQRNAKKSEKINTSEASLNPSPVPDSLGVADTPAMIPATEVTPEKKSIPPFVISPIYYPFDGNLLDEQDKRKLDDVSAYLIQNEDYYLKIVSYTDPRGSKIYNKKLAKQRAQNVVEYLLINGVEQTRLIAEAAGEADPNVEYSEARKTEMTFLPMTESTPAGVADFVAGQTYVSKIYYDFDEFRLNEPSMENLQEVIDKLLADPELMVEILSHTDSRGSLEYNQWLSQKRANEVKRKMIAAGISTDRLKATGKGESSLINGCGDGSTCSKQQHAENRRTEFVFV